MPPRKTLRAPKVAPPRREGGRASIDPDTTERSAPLWRALATRIETDVAAGRYSEAGRLPPEATLARDLGVNRHTLRRAVQALVERGVLRSVPHQGAFINPRTISYKVGAETRLVEAIESAGFESDSRLVYSRAGLAPAEIAEMLAVPKRARMVELSHLKTANALPIAYITSWMTAERFGRAAEITMDRSTLRSILRQIGAPFYRRCGMRISSRAATADEREQLELPRGAHVLIMMAQSCDRSGEPTHVSLYRFPIERVELIVEL